MDQSNSTDTPDASQTAEQRLAIRESENQQLRDEFNSQRAKMKELYLQKEDEVKHAMQEKYSLQEELDVLRKHLQRLELDNNAQKGEIESLQLLVQETVEESSNSSNVEIKRLQVKCTEYEQQINMLNRQSTSSPDIPLAPSAIVQSVTKRIARKLGADPNQSQESLEDSMKKVTKYAQEDAEVLRSLVVPLEEEISALKDKLRDTDFQLQQATQSNDKSRTSDSMSTSRENVIEATCDMCTNYEAQLVSEQAKSKENLDKAMKLEVSLKRAFEELDRETSLRRDTLAEWQTAREEVQKQMESVISRITTSETQFGTVKGEMKRAHMELLDKITKLTVDRETLQERLNSLQTENEKLMGKYSACAKMLQTEDINLPNNLPDLQEYALRQREELIIAVMERERAQETEQTLALLQRDAEELEAHNKDLMMANDQLRKEIENFDEEREKINVIKEQARNTYIQLNETLEKKELLDKKVMEMHGKVLSLQRDLNTSETVQKDFVKLSQTLQVQLERIRASDNEVRWQHDEDVDECSSCRSNFTNAKKKQHCRHCGQIFCNGCLSHTVNSGPRARPSHVCDVCYTILVRDTAPYFSTEVPHTPD